MASSDWVKDISETQFAKEVLEKSSQVTVLVDFTAKWCGPCQILGPILEKLAAEYQGRFILVKVNLDRNPLLVADLGIEAVPTVLAFRNGKLIGRFQGALPETQVRAFIEQVLPTKFETLLTQAAKTLESDPRGALSFLEEADRERPGNEDVAALKAVALAKIGQWEQAKQYAETVTEGSSHYRQARNIISLIDFRQMQEAWGGLNMCKQYRDANPDDAQANYRLGICLAASGDYGGALAMLLRAGELDPAWAKGAVKEAMVRIFDILGQESELAADYRAKLASLIY